MMGIGQNSIHMLVFSKDGQKIFTANRGSASVAVVSPSAAGGPGGGPGGRRRAVRWWSGPADPVARGPRRSRWRSGRRPGRRAREGAARRSSRWLRAPRGSTSRPMAPRSGSAAGRDLGHRRGQGSGRRDDRDGYRRHQPHQVHARWQAGPRDPHGAAHHPGRGVAQGDQADRHRRRRVEHPGRPRRIPGLHRDDRRRTRSRSSISASWRSSPSSRPATGPTAWPGSSGRSAGREPHRVVPGAPDRPGPRGVM